MIGFVLLLIPSPDIATASDKNRDWIRASGQRPIEQAGSLPYTNGNVHSVAESDQTTGGAEEIKAQENRRPPGARGAKQRPAVGGELHWALQGETVAVGEAQQIAKFADKVSRKGSKLLLRLKGGKVVSRESTLGGSRWRVLWG